MNIAISKTLAYRIACVLTQASRSLHRSDPTTPNHWAEFRNYYEGERSDSAKAVFDDLGELIISANMSQMPTPTLQEIEYEYSKTGILSMLISNIQKRFSCSCSIPCKPVLFAYEVLGAFLLLINITENSSFETKKNLRISLATAAYPFEYHCLTAKEMFHISIVEHFGNAPHRKHMSLSEAFAKFE